jgi:hypothetical protein
MKEIPYYLYKNANSNSSHLHILDTIDRLSKMYFLDIGKYNCCLASIANGDYLYIVHSVDQKRRRIRLKRTLPTGDAGDPDATI